MKRRCCAVQFCPRGTSHWSGICTKHRAGSATACSVCWLDCEGNPTHCGLSACVQALRATERGPERATLCPFHGALVANHTLHPGACKHSNPTRALWILAELPRSIGAHAT